MYKVSYRDQGGGRGSKIMRILKVQVRILILYNVHNNRVYHFVNSNNYLIIIFVAYMYIITNKRFHIHCIIGIEYVTMVTCFTLFLIEYW